MKLKPLDVALLLVFMTLLGFVVTVIVCNVKGIQIQDSLVTGFLAIIGAEIATCGGITIFKNRRKTICKKDDDK